MRTFILLLLFSYPVLITAQSEAVTVRSITIDGNSKTRSGTILREITFGKGEAIPKESLSATLKESELLLLSTGLFVSVKIFFDDWVGETNEVDINITVREAWYIYPVPIFELADRNFNVWWVEQNRSLERINYGAALYYANMTGRRDKLELTAKFGYTRKFSVKYDLPYLTANKKLGIVFDVAYFQNREVNYGTDENKQLFYNEEEGFVYQRFRLLTGLNYRPRIRGNHYFEGKYQQNRLSDAVADDLNPDFFLNGRNFQQYFSLRYRYSYDYRDLRYYPLNGYYFEAELEKLGLGITGDVNGLELNLRYDKFYSLNKKFSLSFHNKAKVSIIRERQPYNLNRAIGFHNNAVRGYELYIVDGLDMALTKWSLRYELVNRAITFGTLIPIEAFRYMPLKIYFAFNSDLGYVNGPFTREGNPLNDRLLWGKGVGLDFVFFNDKVISIEYSFNHLNESGIFLHLNLNI